MKGRGWDESEKRVSFNRRSCHTMSPHQKIEWRESGSGNVCVRVCAGGCAHSVAQSGKRGFSLFISFCSAKRFHPTFFLSFSTLSPLALVFVVVLYYCLFATTQPSHYSHIVYSEVDDGQQPSLFITAIRRLTCALCLWLMLTLPWTNPGKQTTKPNS